MTTEDAPTMAQSATTMDASSGAEIRPLPLPSLDNTVLVRPEDGKGPGVPMATGHQHVTRLASAVPLQQAQSGAPAIQVLPLSQQQPGQGGANARWRSDSLDTPHSNFLLSPLTSQAGSVGSRSPGVVRHSPYNSGLSPSMRRQVQVKMLPMQQQQQQQMLQHPQLQLQQLQQQQNLLYPNQFSPTPGVSDPSLMYQNTYNLTQQRLEQQQGQSQPQTAPLGRHLHKNPLLSPNLPSHVPRGSTSNLNRRLRAGHLAGPQSVEQDPSGTGALALDSLSYELVGAPAAPSTTGTDSSKPFSSMSLSSVTSSASLTRSSKSNLSTASNIGSERKMTEWVQFDSDYWEATKSNAEETSDESKGSGKKKVAWTWHHLQ